MRAAVYRTFGAPEVVRVEEIPQPSPGRTDVLIKVHASTVSAADYRARSRTVPRGLGLLAAFGLGVFRPRNRVLGMDAAGVVEAVGAEVTKFRVGDEVIAMLGSRFGGHAEYACISQDGAITAKPRTMTFDEAVSLPFGGLTARAFLDRADVTPGSEVLINGASGAVGTAAVQLAKHRGARVTAVCSGAASELVTSLGADRIIDYTTVDFTTEGLTYDVIVDCVGNAPFEKVEASLNPGGALLLVIADLAGLLLAPWRSRRSGKLVSGGNVQYRSEDLAFLVRLAESGQYQAVIDRTYELSDIVDAHRYVATGHKKGNVVLHVAPSR